MSNSVETIKESSVEVIDEAEGKNSEDDQVELQESSSSSSMLPVDDDLSVLSKPYYHFILSKSHVKPVYHMVFPSRLYPDLPSTTGPAITVPAKVVCHGKTWETTYFADSKIKKLDISWKAFVDDNELRYGDALFLEVIESSNEKVRFKVQIIRGDFPAELEAKVNGNTIDTAIVIE